MPEKRYYRAVPMSDRELTVSWRATLFLACIPSGGALLLKVWGVWDMHRATVWVAVPCCGLLIGAWLWARATGRGSLRSALAIGALGGLIGTVGYDLVRVPFWLLGQRVFAPINAYGVWIVDAPISSRQTDAVGWAYHLSNGITFGIMYALWMRGRHWGWGIAWAMLLETIAYTSPFGRIFGLSGNLPAIAIAYGAHIAYGLPLGLVVRRWERSRRWLERVHPALEGMLLVVVLAALLGPLVSPDRTARDGRAAPGELRVEGDRLNPDWVRIDRGASVMLYNPGHRHIRVRIRDLDAVEVPAGSRTEVTFQATGIYQVHVETEHRSRSSFVIVEPVEAAR